VGTFSPRLWGGVAQWISCTASGRAGAVGTAHAPAEAMRRLGVVIAVAVAIAGALLACGASRLPAPPYVRQPTEALLQAGYPPPPARVEFIPSEPRDGAVWIDGEWTWQGRRWAWKTGRWVSPPPNAAYSPWTSVRDSVGTLYVAEGRWRDKSGNDLPDPPPLALGRVRGGPVINPEGEEVPQAPNIRPDRAPRAADAGLETGAPETPSGATPTGTEPKSGAGQFPEGGAPPDAGIPEVSVRDATPIDAMPLVESSTGFSTRMGPP
jgi:hypothetical protein